MEVILLEKIRNLGNLGDTTKVKAGYARNYLLPTGKALRASKENLALFETKRAELEKNASTLLSEAKQRAEKLEGQVFQVAVLASEEGKLYGSVGAAEICQVVNVKIADANLQRPEVLLPNGVIRELGDIMVDIQVHSEVAAQIKLEIRAQQ